jgi:hypothetical protein
MIPTTNFRVFSGTRASGRWTMISNHQDEHTGRQGTDACSDDQIASRTDGDDHEHHFNALEHHRLEGGQTGDPIGVGLVPPCFFLKGHLLVGEGALFVVQRDDPGRSKDCLAQPAQAEQQKQHADAELQQVDGHLIQEWPERHNQHHEHGEAVTLRLFSAGALMAFGGWLHLSERHEHDHEYPEAAHEHRHSHDEHHDHAHDESVDPAQPHSHWHRHKPLRHAHPHTPDSYHQHSH